MKQHDLKVTRGNRHRVINAAPISGSPWHYHRPRGQARPTAEAEKDTRSEEKRNADAAVRAGGFKRPTVKGVTQACNDTLTRTGNDNFARQPCTSRGAARGSDVVVSCAKVRVIRQPRVQSMHDTAAPAPLAGCSYHGDHLLTHCYRKREREGGRERVSFCRHAEAASAIRLSVRVYRADKEPKPTSIRTKKHEEEERGITTMWQWRACDASMTRLRFSPFSCPPWTENRSGSWVPHPRSSSTSFVWILQSVQPASRWQFWSWQARWRHDLWPCIVKHKDEPWQRKVKRSGRSDIIVCRRADR